MEMEGSWLAIFPSLFVICLIHRAIVNNIPGMGRVFGGILVEIWVSFLKFGAWLVTLQNIGQRTPPVKLTVGMDGSPSWMELMDNKLNQENCKNHWNLLSEIDLFSITYYQYWEFWAKDYKQLELSVGWETQLNYCSRSPGKIDLDRMNFWKISILIGSSLFVGLTEAIYISSMEEQMMVGIFNGIKLIFSMNFLIWICLKDVIRGTLGVGTLITNKTMQWKTVQSQNGKVGVFSVFILIILINLQISNLSQKLQLIVHRERKGFSTPDAFRNNMT
jgi:hypothetical protein